MDYYLRELYGHNHKNIAVDRKQLSKPVNAIDSFLVSVHYFYAEEDLDTNFYRNLNRVENVLGKDHYIVNLGNAMLGENYYTFCFDSDSSNYYFAKHLVWCETIDSKIYDGFWTKIRLTSSGTYFRDNLSSLVQINELLEDTSWKEVLDTIHLSLAYSTRGYIQFRFPKYEEAYEDNLIAISFSEHLTAIPVYQEALKSQLTVTTFWEKDSLWQIYNHMLINNIHRTGIDYVNYDRLLARFYYEKEQYSKSLPFQARALHFELTSKHINVPVVESLSNLHSIELEDAGLFSQAIGIYHISEIFYENNSWTFEELIDSALLKRQYAFVSLVRYGHIYYSWFIAERNPDYLETAENMAMLAHQSYYRDMGTLEENSLLTFAYERQVVLELFCLIYAEKYFITKDKKYLELYYEYAENNRGAIFSRDMKAMWNKYPVPTDWLMKEQRLRVENKRILGEGIVNQSKIEANRDSISLLLNKIKENYPDYYRNIMDQEVDSLSIVQDSLRKHKASILSLDIIGNDLYLLWLTDDESDLTRILLDTTKTKQLEVLIRNMSTKNSISASEYVRSAFEIWQWLIPEKAKEDVHQKWLIIPDGYFHRLNLEALITGRETTDEYGSLEYLLSEKEIAYSPSVRTWLRSKQPVGREGQIVGIGWTDEESNDELSDSAFVDLPGSMLEMECIREAIPTAKIFSGKNATLKRFIKMYTSPAVSTMHLALHGYANSEKQDDIKLFFRSRRWSVDSLFGYDLLPLTSSVNTIILSACESGKGKEMTGEGNYNLPRYFLINGANEVISSLWLVDDDASASLFAIFYKKSSTSTSGKKLRDSKLELISNSKARFGHPYFWANMVLQD